MNGDFSRLRFDKEKHYDAVMMQQGRVLIDADWNEQQEINRHRIDSETRDVVGRSGVPLEGGGFEIALMGLKGGVALEGQLVLVGDLGQVLRYSLKEDNWIGFDISPVSVTLNAVCWNGKSLWAVGGEGGIISREAQRGEMDIISHTKKDRIWHRHDSGVTVKLNKIAFLSPERGWAVGDEGTLLATGNGGESWEKEPCGVWYDLYALSVSQAGCWVVGEIGTILYREIEGQWTPQISDVSTDLYGVCFLGKSQIGWAVGARGVILHTINGGKKWLRQTTPTSVDLHSVFFVDENTGWAVGEAGTVLFTGNGGSDWVAGSISTDYPLREIFHEPGRSALYLAGDHFKLFRFDNESGLYAEYFNDDKDHLIDPPVKARIDSQVDFQWGKASPIPKVIKGDNFSVRWSGWLLPRKNGRYSFQVHTNDSVRLWVQEKLVIEKWGVPPAKQDESEPADLALKFRAGKVYAIRLEYFSATGAATMSLRWKGPDDQDYAPIPSSSLLPYLQPQPSEMNSLMVNGLIGEYFNHEAGKRLKGTPKLVRSDRWGIAFDRGSDSPVSGIDNGYLSVRWTGWLGSPQTGWHTFKTGSDGGVRLWLNGVLVADRSSGLTDSSDLIEVNLQAGVLYSIRLEYFEVKQSTKIQLLWKLPSGTDDPSVIPWNFFFRPVVRKRWEALTDKSTLLPLISSAGRIYVDGILCETETARCVLAGDQAQLAVGEYLVYLDVWKRHITALQDQEIREKALGNVDTGTRSQTVWQVRLQPLAQHPQVPDLDLHEWRALTSSRTALLKASLKGGLAPDTPCTLAPGANYQGLENQLYRVEIHNAASGQETFKWSRDNGSKVFAIDRQLPSRDDVAALATQSRIALRPECAGMLDDLQSDGKSDVWVEIGNDDSELGMVSGLICPEPSLVDNLSLEVILNAGYDDVSKYCDQAKHPFLRVWNSPELKVTGEDVQIEKGLCIQFGKQGAYLSGDYWLIPARTCNEGLIEWPRDGDRYLPKTPHGIEHHYSQLAYLTCSAGDNERRVIELRDLRKSFLPMSAAPAPRLPSRSFHVRSISWGHDKTVLHSTFLEGISIGFDAMPDPTTINDNTLIVTYEFDGSIVIVRGTCDVDLGRQGIRWKPTVGPSFALSAGARVRVVLKGDKIVTVPDGKGERYYLDGQALGTLPTDTDEEAAAFGLIIPSGTGRRASDFESWFFIADSRADTLLVRSVTFYTLTGIEASSLQRFRKEGLRITNEVIADHLVSRYTHECNSSGSNLAGIAPLSAIEIHFNRGIASSPDKSVELFMQLIDVKKTPNQAKVPAFSLHDRLPKFGMSLSPVHGIALLNQDATSIFFFCCEQKSATIRLLPQGLYKLVAHGSINDSEKAKLDGDCDGKGGGDFILWFKVGR